MSTDSMERTAVAATPRSRAKDLGGLAVSGLVTIVIAAIGGLATAVTIDGWYAEAEKTLLNPPNALFGPVWTTLYTLLAFSAWLIWRQPASAERTRALRVYAGQLLFSSAWSPLFFVLYEVTGPSALWIALGWIVVLDFIVLANIAAFWAVKRLAAWLLIPYGLWLLFATALNASIAVVNS